MSYSESRVLLFLSLLLPGLRGGRVLMYLPVCTRSHLTAWTPLATGLAEAGHNVTLVAGHPSAHPLSEGVQEIIIKNKAFSTFQNDYGAEMIANNGKSMDILKKLIDGGRAIIQVHDQALANLEMQSVLRSDEPWDLVIASPLLNEAGVMLADHFKAPLILFLPANAEQLLSMSLGHPDNLAWSGPGSNCFMMRMWTLFLNHIYHLYIKPTYFVEPQYSSVRGQLPNYSLDVESYSDLEKNAEFGFYFSSPLLGHVAPRLPNTVNVGFIHCRPGQPLKPDLSTWMDQDPSTPIVYMSMGSLINSEDLPNLSVLEQVFSKMSIRVIWKMQTSSVSPTMYQADWLDQQNILADRRVKLFVSQLGAMSFQESLYHGVPILALPITYEQKLNAELLTRKNLGLVLDIRYLDNVTLETSIKDILSNEEIRSNVNELSRKIKDTRTTPLEDAVWWSEYVIRHSHDRDHLKSVNRHNLSLLQFFYVDLMIFWTLQILISLGILAVTIGYLHSLFRPAGRLWIKFLMASLSTPLLYYLYFAF